MDDFKIASSSLCGCVGGSAEGAAGGSKDVVWETQGPQPGHLLTESLPRDKGEK